MATETDTQPLIRTKLKERRGRPVFGKTTLVSSWLEACDCPSAWLSLDQIARP